MKRSILMMLLVLSALLVGIEMRATNILVAYFSWGGNTRALATAIQQQTGADIYSIEPQNPYTTNYNTLAYSISNAEKANNARPALSETGRDFSQYDYIFVGCPVWWFDAPMIMHSFLEAYNFSGKTIIPFCTFATATYQTLDDIVNATPDSRHLEGLGVRGSSSYSATTISNWLQRIGIADVVSSGVDDINIDDTPEESTPVYNLMGQRVGTYGEKSQLAPGIYVAAGKKFWKR